MNVTGRTKRSLSLDAPAKVNLFLEVHGRGEDGYHRLTSLMACVDVADRLTAETAAGFSLKTEGPFASRLPATGRNLVARAARDFARATGIACCARLTLTKTLPLAAGLGGGSADAACALRLLDGLWETKACPRMLTECAVALGADVPFCLNGAPALASGIGERLWPVAHFPSCSVVLVNPGVALSTARVFSALKAEDFVKELPWRAEGGLYELDEFARGLRRRSNTLTAAASAIAPVIGRVRDALSAQRGCLLARMSGSGATCFGLFAAKDDADEAVHALTRKERGWWVRRGRFLAGAPSL